MIIEVLTISCRVKRDDITNNDVRMLQRVVCSTSDNLFKRCCLTAYKTVIWTILIGACKTTICCPTAFSVQFTLSGECNDISPSAHASLTSAAYDFGNYFFSMRYSHLRRFRKIAKNDYQLLHVCPSLCPRGTTGLPLDGYSLNFISQYLSKIYRENLTFITI